MVIQIEIQEIIGKMNIFKRFESEIFMRRGFYHSS